MAEKWETRDLHNSHFHTSRDERHEMGGINCEKDKRSFLQRNPSFKIFIIDLIFIVIISGVIVPFLYKREGTAGLEGYRLNLRAFYFDESVMVSLTLEGKDEELKGGDYVEAGFYYEEDPSPVKVSDITPEYGADRVLKTILPATEEEYIFCSVTINGQNKTIKKKIK